jgi:hypothetical protein
VTLGFFAIRTGYWDHEQRSGTEGETTAVERMLVENAPTQPELDNPGDRSLYLCYL